MKKNKQPKNFSEVLSAKKNVESENDQTVLSFDNETGELVITSKGTENPKNVVVDQIYKDGFFCSN